jgi:hypothetical protein
MKCVTVSPASLVGNLNFYSVNITVANETPIQGVEITVSKYFNPQTNNFVDVCSIAYLSSICNTKVITDANGKASLCLIKGTYIITLKYNNYVNNVSISVFKNQDIKLPFFFYNLNM